MTAHGTIYFSLALFAGLAVSAKAQQIDTTGIYGERQDTLSASVFTAQRAGNYLSKLGDNRTEVISAAGLCKMACCNLAESFENSASVTVGYSDAVTGARQIRLLGQNGIYTQMLDENRPVMRGLNAPFGLNYVPGQWLESIQIAKGVTSVINGVESMTGQINMEHRKPTDEKPLFVQASAMNDSKCDLNIASSLQLDEMEKWSTVILAHLSGNFAEHDMNADGFKDDPSQRTMALANRWLYYAPSGLQVRFGLSAVADSRLGGQVESLGNGRWMADVTNRSIDGYVKVGVPLNETNSQNIAFVLDITGQQMQSRYGNRMFNPLMPVTSSPALMPAGIGYRFYNANQQSLFFNSLYQNELNESHKFTLGLSALADWYSDVLTSDCYTTTAMNDLGVFGEYTFHRSDVLSVITGLRADLYGFDKFRFSPRLTVKYMPEEHWVFRANAGRGIRYSNPLIDNFGVLSSSKPVNARELGHPLEESWTAGANVTWYLPFDKKEKTYLSLDWFNTTFSEQVLVGYYADRIDFSLLSAAPGARSYTNNLQLDFSTEPVRGFTATLTARLTDPRQSLPCQSDDIKPMTSLYKGVLNLQYATRLSRWIFDFTASVNGPCRVWDFMKGIEIDGKEYYTDGYTDVYPLLYAQVTRRFKGFDIYLGGENLTGYTQPCPIIDADTPFGTGFDASCVWGPLMGVKLYAGIRMTIWKKE